MPDPSVFDAASGEAASGEPGPPPANPGAEPVTESTAPSVDGSAAVEVTVEDLVLDLERVSQERDDYLDGLRRLQAEFENYRKAVAKREADAKARANDGLVGELLPVLDACDGAINNGADDVAPVRLALLDTLTKQGLERLDPAGAPFDPELHEAVIHEAADGSAEQSGPIVSEVLRVGYGWKGHVVRPAMVKVLG